MAQFVFSETTGRHVMRNAAQLQNKGRDSGEEAARLRRAILEACGAGLRQRYGQEPASQMPPSLSRLIEELRRAEALRPENARA
jgi:hypothetical protein